MNDFALGLINQQLDKIRIILLWILWILGLIYLKLAYVDLFEWVAPYKNLLLLWLGIG